MIWIRFPLRSRLFTDKQPGIVLFSGSMVPVLLSAHPLQAYGARRQRQVALQSFSTLWVVQINAHSPRTWSWPRNKNCRNPRPCLIWPKTGSTVPLRLAYRRRPRFVHRVRRIRSATESPVFS